MILTIYAYKDNEIGRFRNPTIYDRDLESLIDELKVSLKGITKEQAAKLKGNSLYKLGTFDDKTGEIVFDMEFCFDVGPIASLMASLAEEKEEIKDVSVQSTQVQEN